MKWDGVDFAMMVLLLAITSKGCDYADILIERERERCVMSGGEP